MNAMRAWATAIVMAASMLVLCGAAYADPSRSVPNGVASHDCVAATSGLLFFRQHGYHLGQDVRKVAPHGGQRVYVQGALRETC